MKQCIKVYMVFMFVIISPFSLSIKTIPLDSLIQLGCYVIGAISREIEGSSDDASHSLSGSEEDYGVLREDGEDDPETLKHQIDELKELQQSGKPAKEKDRQIIFDNLLCTARERDIPIDVRYKCYISVASQKDLLIDNICFVPLP